MTKFLQVALVFALVAFAQESLTNDSVVKMVKAGLSEPLIVSMIQEQRGRYSLTTDDLVNLKGQGLSHKVLAVMLAKDFGVSASATPTGSSVTSETDLPPDLEIGGLLQERRQMGRDATRSSQLENGWRGEEFCFGRYRERRCERPHTRQQ